MNTVVSGALNGVLRPMMFGEIPVSNRVIMAPLTRLRAEPDGTPGEIVARYYTQRASMGLIVSEGTFFTEVSRGATWGNQGWSTLRLRPPGLELLRSSTLLVERSWCN